MNLVSLKMRVNQVMLDDEEVDIVRVQVVHVDEDEHEYVDVYEGDVGAFVCEHAGVHDGGVVNDHLLVDNAFYSSSCDSFDRYVRERMSTQTHIHLVPLL